MLLTYLNWAGLAPLTPRSYLRSLFAPELLGNTQLPGWFRQVQALRERVANWLGCQPEQVAFLPSTSAALYITSLALAWQPSDQVLYAQSDFPANILPWQRLSRFGAEGIPVSNWEDPWPETVRMVSLSTVDYSTGIEQPWQQVVRRAQAQGIWSCVDAIQSAGVKPSWIPEVDFWCAGTQKWLASGLGLALLVVSQRVLQELDPPMPTWLGLQHPPDLNSGIDPTARGWELGWITPPALARLETNLTTLEHIGWEAVTAGVKQRRDFLHERLLEMGWSVVSCPKRWSGILSFAPGSGRAEAIVQSGYRRRIITAQRGEYVRLSPHIFNTQRELNWAVDWLWDCRVEGQAQRDLQP